MTAIALIWLASLAVFLVLAEIAPTLEYMNDSEDVQR
jgi:hypothetical protein